MLYHLPRLTCIIPRIWLRLSVLPVNMVIYNTCVWETTYICSPKTQIICPIFKTGVPLRSYVDIPGRKANQIKDANVILIFYLKSLLMLCIFPTIVNLLSCYSSLYDKTTEWSIKCVYLKMCIYMHTCSPDSSLNSSPKAHTIRWVTSNSPACFIEL